MAVERNVGESTGEQFLSSDLLYEVLGRVDARTLAKASCVSSQFRSVCREEALWEKLCNSRWPSTKQVSAVKAVVASMGGFRKLYADCFPCISMSNKGARQNVGQLRVCDRDRIEELEEVSASDFVSIVDVVYNGESVLSRAVEGILGAARSRAFRFADCPFRVDVLEIPGSEVDDFSRKDEEGVPAVTIRTKLPRIASVAREKKNGKFWTGLCDEMRVSWILMNKKTLRMVNLASWQPLGGLRHRPSGDDFLLRFGSILPASTANSYCATHCNITMKCSTTAAVEADANQPTTLRVTELSLHLEDVNGTHLNGRNAIATLSRALRCEKTVAQSEAASIYHAFVASQNARRESLIRRENFRRTAEALIVGSITAFICFVYVFS